LTSQLEQAGIEVINPQGVSDEEKQLVKDGKAVAAIKAYRERTGADLLTAKNAIDSVSK
jgi:ribosomal protein L7/L12